MVGLCWRRPCVTVEVDSAWDLGALGLVLGRTEEVPPGMAVDESCKLARTTW